MLESSPSPQPRSQETWVLGLACGTGQAQSRSMPQFLLQTTQGSGFNTKGPSISDVRGFKHGHQTQGSQGGLWARIFLTWHLDQAKVTQQAEDTLIIVLMTQKCKTLCGPLPSCPSPALSSLQQILAACYPSCSYRPGS